MQKRSTQDSLLVPPWSVNRSTSTVGFPRLSKIWRAWTLEIDMMAYSAKINHWRSSIGNAASQQRPDQVSLVIDAIPRDWEYWFQPKLWEFETSTEPLKEPKSWELAASWLTLNLNNKCIVSYVWLPNTYNKLIFQLLLALSKPFLLNCPRNNFLIYMYLFILSAHQHEPQIF